MNSLKRYMRIFGIGSKAWHWAIVTICVVICGCGTLPSKVTPHVGLRNTTTMKRPLSVQVNYERLKNHIHIATSPKLTLGGVTLNSGEASLNLFFKVFRDVFEEVTQVKSETPSAGYLLLIPEIVSVETTRYDPNPFSDPTFCRVVYKLKILNSNGEIILDRQFSGEVSRREKINRMGDVLSLGVFANKLRAQAYSKLFADAAQAAFSKIQDALHNPTAFVIGTPSTPAKQTPSPKIEKVHLAMDKEAPKIIITDPKLSSGDAAVVKENRIRVEGKALDDSGIYQVLVNGSEAILSASGIFTADVMLAVGENMIQVRATDTKGNAAQEIFTIIRKQKLKPQKTIVMNNSMIGRYHALLIGCQEYDNPALQDLEHPIRDIMRLQTVLTELYKFDLGNVSLLKNPDRMEIIKELETLYNTLTPRDNLLIFFAGHGYWDKRSKQGYWLPRNSTRTNRSEWLSNSTIRDFVRSINTRHTLIIADACFSGGIFKSRKAFRNNSEAIEQLYKLPSRKAMTSGTVDKVPDKSVFIKYLLKRLRQNTATYLTSEALFSSFRTAVINNSPIKQVPQFGEIREAGDEGGDFIFIRKGIE